MYLGGFSPEATYWLVICIYMRLVVGRTAPSFDTSDKKRLMTGQFPNSINSMMCACSLCALWRTLHSRVIEICADCGDGCELECFLREYSSLTVQIQLFMAQASAPVRPLPTLEHMKTVESSQRLEYIWKCPEWIFIIPIDLVVKKHTKYIYHMPCLYQ